MNIFTWDDIKASYYEAVRLIDRCHDLVWLEGKNPEDEVEGITIADLFREAHWARSWVLVLAQDRAAATGVKTRDVLRQLREECYPDGHDPQHSGDPLDL